jgi:hypothetical protein
MYSPIGDILMAKFSIKEENVLATKVIEIEDDLLTKMQNEDIDYYLEEMVQTENNFTWERLI